MLSRERERPIWSSLCPLPNSCCRVHAVPGHSRLGLLAAHLIGLCLQLLLDDLLVNVVRISVTNILHVFILKEGGGEEEEVLTANN